MGGFKRRGNKKKMANWNKKKSDGRVWNENQDGRDAREAYKLIERNNDKYWQYYKDQGIISEEEFEAFKATLQADLPVSFRIQGCHKDREQLIHEMETRFFKPLAEAGGDAGVFEPKPLPWYHGAYQTPMSRTAVRSHPLLAQLHNFLVTESELGNLTRQEAVSMIPPLLLCPSSYHAVLDMCAAPGSKTSQLMEMMHEERPDPTGILVANDLDKKRCYMLIHQTLKRFRTANCVVTCEDAARLPDMIGADGTPLRFDRVLCDVICSGDGTVRKNHEIWTKWTPQEGLGLHQLQMAIAKKGLEQLKVGGRMVYSTCSMNPIEDEAVVANLLRESKGSLRLVNAFPLLPELKAAKGISNWKVFDRDMREYATPEDVSDNLKKIICKSVFPPTEEEAKSMNLEYCMRILPHLQDTGGFFVALIEKVGDVSFDTLAVSGPAWKKKKMFKDEPFTFLKENDERWFDIRNHYGIRDDFPYQNLFSRSLDGKDASSRQLFYANDAAKDFVIRNGISMSIQNAGMKMFSRAEQKVKETRFRLSQEGIRNLIKYMDKQKVQVSRDDLLKLLRTKEVMINIDELAAAAAIRSMSNGCVVLYNDEEDPVCTWVGQKTVAPYISKEERLHLMRMMGADCSEIEELMKSKRKEKAAESRDAARAAKDEASENASPADPEDTVADVITGQEQESAEESTDMDAVEQ